ncbi:MAG: tRNA pseudouridine(55) synthase TruB [Candidatus Aminicenantes bacterium RBG_16_63_14]|nr:MAG: tRNA pseudouridine(55) synthase TruB [Candidatus Aminicenantes bacterium RBG_16_63_14]OGD27185.1 MAG: tRNA pseudouridine(55) synthase TruB [Candidatus Aminicenantes bacterium RBG_19FT_COMBO_65_30]
MVSDGLIVIDKPAGLTSHDVVQRVRKLLGTRRVGHGGTLDPDATGVLLVAAGQATRFFPYLSKENKVYEGRIRLGFATDTYDASGRPASEECRDLPALEDLAPAMKAFEGEILQTPPRYSAKKLGGRPVYKLARADKEFTLEPSAVTVVRFAIRAYRPPFVDFEAECSAGTYIRSLAHDLGRRLGCGAHLDTLRRTSIGPYALFDAVPLAGFEEAAARGEAAKHILPLERLLPWVPAVTVLPLAEIRIRHGSSLEPAHLAAPLPDSPPFPGETRLVRLFSGSGKLLALARPSADGSKLHPFLVLP